MRTSERLSLPPHHHPALPCLGPRRRQWACAGWHRASSSGSNQAVISPDRWGGCHPAEPCSVKGKCPSSECFLLECLGRDQPLTWAVHLPRSRHLVPDPFILRLGGEKGCGEKATGFWAYPDSPLSSRLANTEAAATARAVLPAGCVFSEAAGTSCV